MFFDLHFLLLFSEGLHEHEGQKPQKPGLVLSI